MDIKKINWYINRLKAMSIPEVIWRLNQKKLQKKEKEIYGINDIYVCSYIFNDNLNKLKELFDYNKMHINLNNSNYTIENDLWLFEKYSYNDFKNNWNSGFNTNNSWSNEFSYELYYKQNDFIGDARTNWELNRHFQFSILAKNYYLTRDEKFLNELIELFNDWNHNNPFLKGISWTSVMEVSIRAYSWIMTLIFLRASLIDNKEILDKFEIGIINMIDYTDKHHSMYSSANNHLIVEMVVIGIAGVLFNHEAWYKKSIEILDKELVIQNYSDGVNKEHALHYQTFVMESISLLMLILKRNNIQYPKNWNDLLAKMSEFIADNMDCKNNVSNLGDSDEGKILDLCGRHTNHYKYVLELTSLILNRKYVELNEVHENINWLFSKEEIDSVKIKYDNKNSKCYREGGYTIMKSIPSNKNELMFVIDHAELGFGSIAAHGHADSLSFTMHINGNRVFIDPGTFIYHIDLKSRDYFRKTINHNTVTINKKDQSEMLGAFLWGKRANTTLEKYEIDSNSEILVASHDGYKPIIHRRKYLYNRKNNMLIKDILLGENFEWTSTIVLDPSVKIINVNNNQVKLRINDNTININISDNYTINIEDIWISEIYNNKTLSKAIKISGYSSSDVELLTEITID